MSPSAKKMVVWGSIIVGGVVPVVYGLYKAHQAVKSLREIMAGAKSFFSNYRKELAETGAQASVTAAEVNALNDAVETSQNGTPSVISSRRKRRNTKGSARRTGSSRSGDRGTIPSRRTRQTATAIETAEEAVEIVGANPVQTTERVAKTGVLSKMGSRIGRGMKFASAGSKVAPIIGTVLSVSQLLGMNKSNAGNKLGGFGGSLAGGAAGAAIGSAIAPGIGTAIGGAVGSIAGSKFGEKFGAAVQKKWPGIQKSIDGFTEKHPILSKMAAITAPISGLVLYGHKAAQSLKKDFKEPLDTTVNFGKTVHSTTAKAVNNYMDLASKSKVQLGLLAANGDKYSKSARDSINKNFSSMVTLVQKSFDKTKNSTKNNLSTLVKNGLLSDKEAAEIEKKQAKRQKDQLKAVQDSTKKMIQINNDGYKKERQITSKAESEINAIKSNAAKKGRTLTKQEQDKIKDIESKASSDRKKIAQRTQAAIAKEEEKQRKNVTAALSKSAKEQKLILGKLKDDSGTISAKQAADIVKQSARARDGAVKEARQKYKEVTDAADKEYYVNGTITKKQHDELIQKAKDQRDQAIKAAKDMHQQVVDQATKQAKGHISEVDWETGNTLNAFQQWGMGVAKSHQGVIKIINGVLKFLHLKTIPLDTSGINASAAMKARISSARKVSGAQAMYASGTDYHGGGHAVVGEEGPELAYIPYKGATLVGQNGAEIVNLPRGTKVLPHAQTKQMLNGGLKGTMPGYASGVGVKDILSWLTSPFKQVEKLVASKLPKKDIGDGLGAGLLKYSASGIGKWLKDEFKDIAGSFTVGGAAGSSQVKQWLLSAMAITGTPASYLGALTRVAMHESGGNPRAINLWDSNAKAGHPSKGLMQTIDSTFNTYKLPGLGDIWNPVANAVAAIRYMNARYGSISNVPGVRSAKYVGYKSGGRKRGNDTVLVGEKGPELADLPDGTQITNATKTQELLKRKNGNVNITIAPVINIKIDGGTDTTESKIDRAVRTALEKVFKDYLPIIESGVAY
ncbi:transglycosylase SLT domain-containing protein [Bacillus coagulans]|nr:transglycosylase SLT domain-containing protein [Heyndrickxia coagulans]